MTGRALGSAERPLATEYDVALLDLDGVAYRGSEAVAGAAAALVAARAAGMRLAFVTNNASRTPEVVAAHLTALGVTAAADEVVTSAQAVARILSARLPAGARVLVLGAAGLLREVVDAGFDVVRGADDDPAAVVQGLAPEATYADLTEATLAVARGALWVAANLDSTMPTPRGLVPGNGALVAVVATATGRTPLVAGKPERALHDEAVRRSGAQRPLVVGDRLDTDIAGAVAVGAPSLLVLTGVTTRQDLLAAPLGLRPTYVAPDLSGLLYPQPAMPTEDSEITRLRALVAGAWSAMDAG